VQNDPNQHSAVTKVDELVRFTRIGGIPMLRMMGGDPDQPAPQSAAAE
jgi:hypothetical protein